MVYITLIRLPQTWGTECRRRFFVFLFYQKPYRLNTVTGHGLKLDPQRAENNSEKVLLA